MFGQLAGVVGPDAAQLIQAAVAKANHTKGGVLGTIIGFVALLAGATGVVIELQGALDTVWKVEPKPNRGIWGVVRTRLLSVAMILSLGFLLLVSLVVSAVLAALSGWLHSFFGDVAIVSWVIDGVVALGVISTMIALIYKILPDAHVAWRDVWVGAVATAILFMAASTSSASTSGRPASARRSARRARWRCCSSGSTTPRRSCCSAPSSPASTQTGSARGSGRPAGRSREERGRARPPAPDARPQKV